MVHAPRLGRQFGDPGDRELRRRAIAKEVYQPVHLVSACDIQGVGPHFRYYAGDFMRRDDRETALALFVSPSWVPRKLGRGNCSCVHFDQHLATIRHRTGNGFIDQSFRTTSMVAADRIHCLSRFHSDGLQNSKVTGEFTLSGYRSARDLAATAREEGKRNFNATAVVSVRNPELRFRVNSSSCRLNARGWSRKHRRGSPRLRLRRALPRPPPPPPAPELPTPSHLFAISGRTADKPFHRTVTV